MYDIINGPLNRSHKIKILNLFEDSNVTVTPYMTNGPLKSKKIDVSASDKSLLQIELRNLGKLLFYENIFVERKKVTLHVLTNGKHYST